MNHACSCAAPGTTGNEGWKDWDIYFPVQISVARESYPGSGFAGAVMWLVGIAVIPRVAEMAISFQQRMHLHSYEGIFTALL